MLDDRVLPSVNATLKGGVLKVIADASQGTSQVEIVQSPDQITVEDTGTVVNSFDATQIQQIDFKYRELQHQHTKLNLDIPVSGGQMTLTGFAASEVDLGLGGNALTATAAALLPDGTALSLTGAVDNQGQYDLIGTADINVAGFSLPGTSFELTNTSLAAASTLALGSESIGLSGTVDNQGNYDLMGTADISVAGFTLPNAAFTLTNAGLGVGATVSLPDNTTVSLNGTLTVQGQFALTGSADVMVGGFALANASFVLDNSGLNITADASIAIDQGAVAVHLAGSVRPDGQFWLGGDAQATFAGFVAADASFTLTNTGLGVWAYVDVSLGTDTTTVLIGGDLQPDGTFRLAGTARASFGGFVAANALFALSNTGLTVSGNVDVQVDQATLSVSCVGYALPSGQYRLTGTAAATFAGFAATHAAFTLSNSGLAVEGNVNVPVDQATVTVYFVGSIQRNGQFQLEGTAQATFAGFAAASADFTLTNTGLTVSGDVAVKLDAGAVTVHFAGALNTSGQFRLVGMARATFAGFVAANAIFTLSNSGLVVSGNVAVSLDAGSIMVLFAGEVHPDGQYQLVGTARATFAGFVAVNAAFTLSNGGLTAEGNVNVQLGTNSVIVHFLGTVQTNGQYLLTGTTQAAFGSWSTQAGFRLTNAGLTAAGDVIVKLDTGTVTVHFTGTVSLNGQFSLVGTAQANFVGWSGTTTFTLTNTGLAAVGDVAVKLDAGSVTVHFVGTIQPNDQFLLTGTAQANFVGWSGTAAFTLTNTGLAAAGDVSVKLGSGSVIVHFAGVAQPNGQFRLTGTAQAAFGSWSGNMAFTLSNTGLTGEGNVNVLVGSGSVTVHFLGAIQTSGQFQLTGTAQANFVGWSANTTFTLTNSGLTAVGDVAVKLAAGSVSVHFVGAVQPNGQFSLMGTAQANFVGWSANTTFTLTNSGLTAVGDVAVKLDAGSVTVHFAGMVQSNGQFHLEGTVQANFGGFISGNAHFVLTNGGLAVDGDVAVRLDSGSVTVHFVGAAQPNGQYSLVGNARASFAGFIAASARFTLSNSGVTIEGDVNVWVATVHFVASGYLHPDGQFRLVGSAQAHFGSFLMADAVFTLANSGLTVAGNVTIVGFPLLYFQGWVRFSDGQYFLSGQTPNISYVGFSASANFTLSNDLITVNARVNVLYIGYLQMSGWKRSNGDFYLYFGGGFSIIGFGCGGYVEVESIGGVKGAHVHTNSGFSAMGISSQMDGWIYSNGNWGLSFATGLNIGPLHGGIEFYVGSNGFRVHAHGTIDATVSLPLLGDFGLRISADAWFSISTNGAFDIGGTFQAYWYLGFDGSIGVGFHLWNAGLDISTPWPLSDIHIRW